MDEEEVATEEKPRVRITVETFEEQLRYLAKLSNEVDQASAALKELKDEEDMLSYALAQHMLTGAVKSIVLDNISFTQKQRVYSKVEDKEGLRAWIQEHDAVDMLMTVHPSKLTAYCNEQLEAGGETPTGVNPNFIKYYVHVKQK